MRFNDGRVTIPSAWEPDALDLGAAVPKKALHVLNMMYLHVPIWQFPNSWGGAYTKHYKLLGYIKVLLFIRNPKSYRSI